MRSARQLLPVALTLCCFTALNVCEAEKPANPGKGGGGHQPHPYNLVDLLGFTVAYPEGTYVQSTAAAVNEPDQTGSVQVIGVSAFNWTDNQSHPVLWDVDSDGTFTRTDLGLPPEASQAEATDVNDLGVITIKVEATFDTSLVNWVSVPGKPLQHLTNQGNGWARRLNNVGEIVGGESYWQLKEGIPDSGLNLWRDGFQVADIADSGLMAGHDGNPAAFGENPWKDYFADGQIPSLARFDSEGNLQVESIPQPGVTEEFFLMPGSATSVSPDGTWVAGWLTDYSGTAAQAFVWSEATGMVFLNPLGGTDCVAAGVNNKGQVVGWSDTGDRNYPISACLWQDGQAFDLNVLAGAGGKTNLLTASGINGAGHVVGYMDLKVKGGGTERHAYVLLPSTK